jgi:glycosyltransferase involved in cell wall biosynthesis
MSDPPTLSIVSPVYKAEKIVPELVKRIAEACTAITPNFEIVLVEDGSPDGSWDAIAKECEKDPRVKGIKLSRNFGQHYAITAGLAAAKGDYVVVMDCDLQDNPKYIPELVAAAKNGNDVVFTYRSTRRHSFLKNLTAQIFYSTFNFLIDNKDHDAKKQIGTYTLLTRKAVEAFLSHKEYQRQFLMVVRMIGFNREYVKIEHERRFEGTSSYTLGKLIKIAFSAITSYSDKLLRVSIVIGFVIFVLSLLWALLIVYQYFNSHLLNGYASLMASHLLGTGLVLMSIGVAGIYIGTIFNQVKERPLYIIDKTQNL